MIIGCADTHSVVESALGMLGVAIAKDSGGEQVTVCTGPLQERQHPVAATIEGVRSAPLSVPLFEGIKQEAFVPLILAHYRNQLLHMFTVEGLVALSLRTKDHSGACYTIPISKSKFLS